MIIMAIPYQNLSLAGDCLVHAGSIIAKIGIYSELCVSSVENIICKTQTIVVIIQVGINYTTRL